jgi:hypothetical protein
MTRRGRALRRSADRETQVGDVNPIQDLTRGNAEVVGRSFREAVKRGLHAHQDRATCGAGLESSGRCAFADLGLKEA